MMDKKQIEIATKTFVSILEKHTSMRALGRAIDADASDISLWKHGRKPIRVKAVITMCKLFNVEPQLLRPDIFDQDVIITFKKGK
jgi:hypothetical protein